MRRMRRKRCKVNDFQIAGWAEEVVKRDWTINIRMFKLYVCYVAERENRWIDN